MALTFAMTGLPPVRMRYPLLGTLKIKDLTLIYHSGLDPESSFFASGFPFSRE
jgi:hypothetical protein